MNPIRRLKKLKHLEINLPMVNNELIIPISSVDENACVRLLHFLEAGLETGLNPIFLNFLHVKMGEWTIPPFS